jgi:hypothetical protein
VVPSPPSPSGLIAATLDGHHVQLTWVDNATSGTGFEIERSTSGSGGPFTLLATVGPDVTSHVDSILAAQSEFCYRVRAAGCAGSSDFTPAGCVTTPVGIETGPVTEFELGRVAPNPSRGPAHFQFSLPSASRVRLEILDVQGRQLAVLADGERGPGRHEVSWLGPTEGTTVASGVYFLRFTGPGRVITRRFVVLARLGRHRRGLEPTSWMLLDGRTPTFGAQAVLAE